MEKGDVDVLVGITIVYDKQVTLNSNDRSNNLNEDAQEAKLVGVFTDGDFRRLMTGLMTAVDTVDVIKTLERDVRTVMTSEPFVVDQDHNAYEIFINYPNINQFVVMRSSSAVKLAQCTWHRYEADLACSWHMSQKLMKE